MSHLQANLRTSEFVSRVLFGMPKSTVDKIGYGEPSKSTVLKYTIFDVYLFEQHVSTLLLGHLQAVEVYKKVIWFTPTCWHSFGSLKQYGLYLTKYLVTLNWLILLKSLAGKRCTGFIKTIN
jgi:hypothetical protein